MKTAKLRFVLPLLIFASFACVAQKADSTSNKLLGKLFGVWTVESATGKKLTMANAPMGNPTTIKFTKEARYIFMNNGVKIDSGSFNTNESQSTIYLQSAADKQHLQEWKVNLKSNTAMTLTGKKGSKSEGATFVCSKPEATK